MIQVIKQRDYIENFCDFVKTFLITENATIYEIELVEANLNCLKDRIQKVKETTIKAQLSGKPIN
jgi:hypothetical protein